MIGSDHAALRCSLLLSMHSSKWHQDTRPRKVSGPLPTGPLLDFEDVQEMARKCTKPYPKMRYADPPEVHQAIAYARTTGAKADWKQVHKLRKQARKIWEEKRISGILQGDWSAYRQRKSEQNRKSGWWGRMLEHNTEEEITAKTREHLEEKLCGQPPQEWDEELQRLIKQVHLQREDEWEMFTLEELRAEIGKMKKRTAVGVDMVSIELLSSLASHEQHAPDLLGIFNQCIRDNAKPQAWNTSILALLAKVVTPLGPSDLRPIAMSLAASKLANRLVMSRVFPHLRGGTDVSCCGKNRQAADLVGCMTRLRDMTREWKIPLLVAKLDIRGAFDALSRHSVAHYLQRKLHNHPLGRETRFLMAGLQSNLLDGVVPGGERVQIRCSTGIKQGAPESAELFALVLEDAIEDMRGGQAWKALGWPIDDLPLDMLMYQDDLFVWERDARRLEQRLELIDSCIQRLGLALAPKKTAVASSLHYVGRRTITLKGAEVQVLPSEQSIRVLGLLFSFDGDSCKQARELIARARSAFHKQRDLLRGRAPWENKMFALKALVEGTFSWVAGAIYWGADDLQALNTLQVHILRDIFRLRRHRDEAWVDWNQRTFRDVRAWLHHHQIPRWSTRVRNLQFGLAGHWSRQWEDDGRGIEGSPGVPMRFLRWRSLGWWRNQQLLTPSAGGMRHRGTFYPANFERELAEALGVDWPHLGQDRVGWESQRERWLAYADSNWCRHRQKTLMNV